MAKFDSERMRVLRIIARMNVGGPAIQVTTLMNYLSKDDIEQVLITGICEPGEVDYLELNDIDLDRIIVSSFKRRLSMTNDLIALFKIRAIIKSFQPHIVHTHTFKAGLLGRLASLTVKNRPVLVHTFHGHLLDGYLGGVKLLVLKKIERLLALKTKILVSVGERVMRELLAAGIGNVDKFKVVSPGFPMPWVEKNLLENKIRLDNFVCVWIGRLVEVKAPERLLEISRLLYQNDRRIQFLVIGDGPLRSQIQRQSELESLPIRFLGWRADIQQELIKANMLILTSLNEGTPISIIEAQRMGRPVISTDVGSVAEVISDGKSGYAVQYSADKFAELILEFSNSQERLTEFSDEAIRFSGEKFSPERLANDYSSIYKLLVSS